MIMIRRRLIRQFIRKTRQKIRTAEFFGVSIFRMVLPAAAMPPGIPGPVFWRQIIQSHPRRPVRRVMFTAAWWVLTCRMETFILRFRTAAFLIPVTQKQKKFTRMSDCRLYMKMDIIHLMQVRIQRIFLEQQQVKRIWPGMTRHRRIRQITERAFIRSTAERVWGRRIIILEWSQRFRFPWRQMAKFPALQTKISSLSLPVMMMCGYLLTENLFWISAAAAFRCHCLIRISFPRRRTCALAFCGCRKKWAA